MRQADSGWSTVKAAQVQLPSALSSKPASAEEETPHLDRLLYRQRSFNAEENPTATAAAGEVAAMSLPLHEGKQAVICILLFVC